MTLNMASAAVAPNQQRSDSSVASKSARPHGQIIGSTPVDNQSDEKIKEAPAKCNHFSIRGYVSEVRKRDPKLCDPFSPYVSREGSTDTKHELPPMVVPKFKWWKCDGCILGVGSSNGIGNKSQKSTNEVDAPMPLIEHTSEVDAPRERNTDQASTSTDSNNDNRNVAPSSTICADPKGKGKAHVEDELVPQTGYENGFLKDSSSQGIQQHTTGGIEATRSVADEVILRSTQQKNCRPNGIQIGPSKEHLNHEDDTSNQTSQVKPVHTSLIDGAGTEVAGIFYGPGGDGKGRLVSLPDLNEFNGEPSDDDDENDNEALPAGNSNLCEDDDDYLGAERRKTPKIRLLSELLGLKENHSDAKLKKKNPSFSSFAVSDSQGGSTMNENAKRKRVCSQDEESKSVEIKGLSNGTKKLRTLQVEISESESEDESTEIISEAFTKRRNRSTREKSPLFEKGGKKVNFVDHGASSSSMSRQKIIPKSSQEKGKSSNCDRVTDLPRKTDALPQVEERNLVLTKSRGKNMLQGGKEQTSLSICKNHMPRDGKEAMKKGTEHVRNEPSHDGYYTGKGTYHFPESYFPVGNNQICVPPPQNGMYPHPSPVEHMLLDASVLRKHTENRNIGETNLAFKASGSAAFVGSQFDGNRERNTGSKSNLKRKQAWFTETGDRCPLVHHSVKQVSNSVMNQKELTNEVRGRIQDIDINSIPTDDKVPEQGIGDDNHDIPMDIVELMAKNQYERNLSDPKEKHNPVSLPNYDKTVRSNGNNSNYGENMSTLGQPHFLSMQKPIITDSRNMFNGYEDMGSCRQKLLGPYSDLNQNHVSFRGNLRENQVSGYNSTISLNPNNWNRQMSGVQRCLPGFLQTVDSYNRFRVSSSPRPNIDPRVWPPSMVASRMPVGITKPEMISPSSNSTLNKGKMHHHHHHHPGPNILNFSGVNLGKQNMNFSNGSYNSGGPVESSGLGSGSRPAGKQKPMGSVDLYSNEAIPAMHLLSLMQSAAKMRPPSPMDGGGKAEILKRPPNFNNQESGPPVPPVPLSVVGPSSSRQPLLENNGRISMLENSCHPCYPALPPGPHFASSSFQNDGPPFGRNTGFISPIPLTSRGQRNMESSHFVSPGGDHRPHRSVPCDVGRKRALASSAFDKGKGISGILSPSSSAMISPLPTSYGKTVVWPSTNKEICMVNRNPSEFNDLKELSRYTIGPEDLRPRGGAAREKSARPRGDAKRPHHEMRMNKQLIPSGKDRDRQRKP